MKRLLIGLMSTACLMGASAAYAADPPERKRGPKVIELEAMVIEGKISKPQVFYVLGRSRVEYENLRLQRTFVDRIVTSAKKNPF